MAKKVEDKETKEDVKEVNSKKTAKEEEKEVKKQETKKVENSENVDSGIEISNDVIAVIAGVAVSEVQGISAMSGGFAGGISEVLSRKEKYGKRNKS